MAAHLTPARGALLAAHIMMCARVTKKSSANRLHISRDITFSLLDARKVFVVLRAMIAKH
jgi:hypothetical protein